MPGTNAVIGTIKNRVSLPNSEVDGLWIAVSHRPATPTVTVAECVDNALGEILQPQRNSAALRFETQRAFPGSISAFLGIRP
jgi:hypothetical protein